MEQVEKSGEEEAKELNEWAKAQNVFSSCLLLLFSHISKLCVLDFSF